MRPRRRQSEERPENPAHPEEDAYRYVDELFETRDQIEDAARLVWRVKYDVHKGRERAEKDCEMFMESPTLLAAAQRATMAGLLAFGVRLC
jgi:hypothetical protein